MELVPKFTVELDGQEAQMIITALIEHADRCREATRAKMDKTLAHRIGGAKQAFHARAYTFMAAQHGLPAMAVPGNPSVHEASQQAKSDAIINIFEEAHKHGCTDPYQRRERSGSIEGA